MYIYNLENNEFGITWSSSFYTPNTKFNQRPLISSKNQKLEIEGHDRVLYVTFLKYLEKMQW
jgi:hypothetical protein